MKTKQDVPMRWRILLRFHYGSTHINYAVVLERIPTKHDEFDTPNFSDTILPESIETVHPCFAIDCRNRWMLQQSDYVVTYVRHSWGGAAKFANEAKRLGKVIIEI